MTIEQLEQFNNLKNMDLNKAMLIGRLTKDPELRTTATGQNVATFGVATNLTWTDQSGQKQERAEFHNIVVWRKLAEICAQYLRKGGRVYIEGRIQTRSWTGQDGNKRYTTEINADNMIMLDRAQNTQGGGGASFPPPQAQAAAPNNNFQSPPIQAPQAAPTPVISADEPVAQPVGQADNPQEDEVKVEDIPF